MGYERSGFDLGLRSSFVLIETLSINRSKIFQCSRNGSNRLLKGNLRSRYAHCGQRQQISAHALSTLGGSLKAHSVQCVEGWRPFFCGVRFSFTFIPLPSHSLIFHCKHIVTSAWTTRCGLGAHDCQPRERFTVQGPAGHSEGPPDIPGTLLLYIAMQLLTFN